MTVTRPLRADAARNRESLLVAAAAEFAERGADASISDIARRAGVGKGTVFRHFPTKDHLLVAIVLDRMATLSAAGEALLGGDPEAGLVEFLTVSAEYKQQLDLSFLLAASPTVVADPEVARARDRMFQATYALVERAQEHGVVRADVTGADVILLMCAPNYVAGPLLDADPELWRRYLAMLFDGLRPAGAHPLPHPAPASPLPPAPTT
ncbi:helix-turn-helix domain-containing protein [Longispora sp. NPDC051575]|uniref:TetR/AcrR family transcriptional regulator n=1 Tax=Longispora sp. NPDC051575 TaxID=3154943 RepID=UPI00342F0214